MKVLAKKIERHRFLTFWFHRRLTQTYCVQRNGISVILVLPACHRSIFEDRKTTEIFYCCNLVKGGVNSSDEKFAQGIISGDGHGHVL
jgi:hypothetical protein